MMLRTHTLEESRAAWNARAASFAHKGKRSEYIGQLMELLAPEEGESVFDMGSGSGTLAVPLAKRGHRVTAVDFSCEMLRELREQAKEAGVLERISTFERAWQDDWSDLPQADVAVASRSLIVEDVGEALAKLEGQARKRAALAVIAGETPLADARLFRAFGREVDEKSYTRDFAHIVELLFKRGRLPKVDYIRYNRRWHGKTEEELRAVIERTAPPRTDEERTRFEDFYRTHVFYNETLHE